MDSQASIAYEEHIENVRKTEYPTLAGLLHPSIIEIRHADPL